jgi:hypothetical protein
MIGAMKRTHTARTAVVVTDDPGDDAFGVLMDDPDIDVVVFESAAKAYRRIKREKPVAVIVYLLFDSATEFLLLTMLKLDPETATIPIWTCADLREPRPITLFDFDEAGVACCSSSYFQPS